ncbi:MAG: 3-dehydroquinate synthase [Candidatus Omnitrophica bacterium]|nr:3-dehydroquinate synthase [Candidatus Omnitrophota bacterium]
MQTIRVNLGKRSYDIVAGNGIIKFLGTHLKRLNIGNDAYVITNPLIKNKFGSLLSLSLQDSGFSVKFKTVPDTEKSKSIETAFSLIKDISRYDKKRRIFIIALGGGVIGDLSGFIASAYKRGIPYIQIPTTLLAQVDSSIGGKTAVDLPEAKNLVGAFYQPRLVFSDIELLKSLSARQVRSGLAEVIKYAIIKDAKLFYYLEKNLNSILLLKPKPLTRIIQCCSKIKAKVVGEDEREEKGIRTILNFGHTVGHAIEAASGYKSYNHGEAIALGMLVAADLSEALKLIDRCTVNRIEKLIKYAGLPIEIKKITLRKIISAHYRDKKFIGSRNRFVLITGIGKTKITENVPLGLIQTAIKRRIH